MLRSVAGYGLALLLLPSPSWAWEIPGYQGWCELLGLCSSAPVQVDCVVCNAALPIFCALDAPPPFTHQVCRLRFHGTADAITGITTFPDKGVATVLDRGNFPTDEACSAHVYDRDQTQLPEGNRAPLRQIETNRLPELCETGFSGVGLPSDQTTRNPATGPDLDRVVEFLPPEFVGVREYPPMVLLAVPLLFGLALLWAAFRISRRIVLAFQEGGWLPTADRWDAWREKVDWGHVRREAWHDYREDRKEWGDL